MRGLMLTMALIMAPAAYAQDERRDMEVLIAQTAISAMQPSGYGEWAYRWSPTGSRMSLVRWHLAPPNQITPAGMSVRTGWLSTMGAQVHVMVCGGDEHVMAFALRSNAFLTQDTMDELVVEALRAAGAELRARAEPGAYDIAAPGREGVLRMESARECTPPESAAAPNCWTDMVFTLPTLSDDAVGAQVATDCNVGALRHMRYVR